MKDSAGMWQPIWARMTARQTYLSKVDLPPIFGPVSKSVDGLPRQPKYVSLGMKELYTWAAAVF